MIFPTLYKINKNSSIQSWSIWTENNTIFTKFGILNGAQQISQKIILSKNVGSSNETSPSEQAEKEALSTWKHKLNNHYSESISTKQHIAPMLAAKFEDHKRKLSYPLDVQPKLDGVRALSYWEDDRIVLLSRGNKEYNVTHIKEQLKLILPKGMIFDGEIYTHGVPFQTIVSWVKKETPESTQLQYWVYDAFEENSNLPWKNRNTYLNYLRESIQLRSDTVGSIIEIVQSYVANSEQDVYDLQTKFVEQGFEGAIARSLTAPYIPGFRSNDLLKVKSFQDEEYPVVSFSHGQGKFQDCVIWICLDPATNQTFSVVPKASLKEKQNLLITAYSYIGQLLRVKFFGLTDSGLPRFPVGLGFRPEEDLP